MPADASIFNAFASKPKSAVEYQNDFAAADDARLGRQKNMLQLQVAQQGVDDDTSFRNYLAGGPDLTTSAGQMGLYRASPKSAPGFLKGQADLAKATADTRKTVVETDAKTYELKMKKATEALRDIGNFSSADEAIQSLIAHHQAGDVDAQKAQMMFGQLQQLRGNQQGFSQWQQQMRLGILDAKDRLEQEWKSKEYTDPKADALLSAQTSRANNAASVGATIRGQDIGQSTALSAQAVTRRGQDLADNRAANSGTKMTEDQGKATGWLVQAENAFKNMEAVGFKDGAPTRAAKPGAADGIAAIPMLGGVGNAMRSANRQKFLQAASSGSEALLRAATGAGVNRDEAAQKIQEITPQFGDTDDVIEQKMKAIPLYIESLRVRAGPGADKAAAIGARAAGPQAGSARPLQSKVVGGKTYANDGKGWYLVN